MNIDHRDYAHPTCGRPKTEQDRGGPSVTWTVQKWAFSAGNSWLKRLECRATSLPAGPIRPGFYLFGIQACLPGIRAVLSRIPSLLFGIPSCSVENSELATAAGSRSPFERIFFCELVPALVIVISFATTRAIPAVEGLRLLCWLGPVSPFQGRSRSFRATSSAKKHYA